MSALSRIRLVLERALEVWLILLIVGLTAVVVYAVVSRKLGASLVWYDEVASVVLAWITYYGSALAALKRGHIGFDGVLLAMPPRLRMAAAMLGEAVVVAFFLLLALAGWKVLQVVGIMTLISLPWVPVLFTQSVIPIGALLFVLCELLSLPDYRERLRRRISAEQVELEEQLHLHQEGTGR